MRPLKNLPRTSCGWSLPAATSLATVQPSFALTHEALESEYAKRIEAQVNQIEAQKLTKMLGKTNAQLKTFYLNKQNTNEHCDTLMTDLIKEVQEALTAMDPATLDYVHCLVADYQRLA